MEREDGNQNFEEYAKGKDPGNTEGKDPENSKGKDPGNTEGKDPGNADSKNLEELLEEVESVLERLEEGDISLEESFALYEQGIRELKLCNDKIDFVEKKMAVIRAEGNPEEF